MEEVDVPVWGGYVWNADYRSRYQKTKKQLLSAKGSAAPDAVGGAVGGPSIRPADGAHYPSTGEVSSDGGWT